MTPTPTRIAPAKIRRRDASWLWLTLFTVLGLGSAAVGASLAVLLNGSPLQQRWLSQEEAKTFFGEPVAKGFFGVPQLNRPVNILFMGIKVLALDPEAGYQKRVNDFEGLTDTMILARFDPTTDTVTAISLPRDTQVLINSDPYSKLNEANSKGGPALAAETVSTLMGGVAIDRYVRVNPMGVEALVDALGGITINVPKDLKYQDDSQHLYINIKAGPQKLTGKQALHFLLFRQDGLGDIGRIQRQQIFMRAFQEQALTPQTITRLPQIFGVVKEYVDTNLTGEELFALANFAQSASREKFQMILLPGQFGGAGRLSSYWIPEPTRIQTVAVQHFGLTVPAGSLREMNLAQIEVVIQNSTGERAAVTALTEQLLKRGYQRLYREVPWHETLNQTVVIAQQGNVQAAQAVRDALGFGEVRVDSTGILNSDVTVRIGRDWRFSLAPSVQ
ncbi:cell envelope-related transcriptional attenuator [Gloeomargarita lithophora Alchichica-D10]|uniref:Cell envelope-related transcriptional attenuator n=1 Tax=Gloeomargarita lithophora Alchichica-D10 TaxID=1188229 RepID=A0A1J0AE99_9CYAN|nr:LCP family protein [Gloeomargarita lithophora]APB34260.1 cell envelope-related transcriptional attenuator [Gloeomargarita lithophora Alchichica-D10]